MLQRIEAINKLYKFVLRKNEIIAVPAFHDLPSKENAFKLWEEGKDYRTLIRPIGWVGGPYFSIRDHDSLEAIGITEIVSITRNSEFVNLSFGKRE